MRTYDEHALLAKLELLDRRAKTVFAVSCAQRLFPLFERYAPAVRAPALSERLAEIVAAGWDLAATPMGEVQRMEAEATSMVPDEDDDGWVRESAFAQNVAAPAQGPTPHPTPASTNHPGLPRRRHRSSTSWYRNAASPDPTAPTPPRATTERSATAPARHPTPHPTSAPDAHHGTLADQPQDHPSTSPYRTDPTDQSAARARAHRRTPQAKALARTRHGSPSSADLNHRPHQSDPEHPSTAANPR